MTCFVNHCLIRLKCDFWCSFLLWSKGLVSFRRREPSFFFILCLLNALHVSCTSPVHPRSCMFPPGLQHGSPSLVVKRWNGAAVRFRRMLRPKMNKQLSQLSKIWLIKPLGICSFFGPIFWCRKMIKILSFMAICIFSKGFLSSNLRVHASPDFYYGMTGFDTSHLQAKSLDMMRLVPSCSVFQFVQSVSFCVCSIFLDLSFSCFSSFFLLFPTLKAAQAVALEELELGPQECSKARTEFQDAELHTFHCAAVLPIWSLVKRSELVWIIMGDYICHFNTVDASGLI